MNLTKQIFFKFNLNFLKRFSSIRVSSDRENLIVDLQESTVEKFPLVWLRDNCRCDKCLHFDSQSRIINWNEFQIDVKVKSLEITQENVLINWEDNHKSDFGFNWLKERSFLKESQEKYLNENFKLPKVVWDGRGFLENLQKHNYGELLNKEENLYNWLKDLARYGVAFIKNAPIDKNECHRFSQRIAFIRKTHYGEAFHVVAKPGTSNVAYLSSLLQLHTDLPYYDYKPGVTVLHCIEQTDGQGGENLLTDVFYIAEKLRHENKKVFDILSTVEVNWLDIGEEDGVKFHSIFRGPMICLDSKGNVDRVRHSIPQRDSHFTVDLKFVRPWYEALRIFVDLINAHAARFKLYPGEMFGFDNTRLVHGRLPYQDTTANRRFLVGFYMDWDEVYSKMRILKKQLGTK